MHHNRQAKLLYLLTLSLLLWADCTTAKAQWITYKHLYSDKADKLLYLISTFEKTIIQQDSPFVIIHSPDASRESMLEMGYGKQKERAISSAVVSIPDSEFNQGNINHPLQLIQGKVAGLTIAKAGSNPNDEFYMRLRGLSTINAYDQPLVVINGVPDASLDLLDPQDIASIEILKDASATAIYGIRGASGVLLITTKNGTRSHLGISYHSYLSLESPGPTIPVMSAAEYREKGRGLDIGSSTDWHKSISRTALSHVHNASFSGRADHSDYRVSLNVRDVEGIAIHTGFSQINARVSLSQKAFNDRLKLTFNLAANTRNEKKGFDEAFHYATIYNPTAPIRDDGIPFEKYDGFFQQKAPDYYNPVSILEQNTNEAKSNGMILDFRGNFLLRSGLTISAFYAQQRKNDLAGQYFDRNSLWRGMDQNGLAVQSSDERFTEILDLTGTLVDTFDMTVMNLLAGYSWQEFKNEGLGAAGGDFFSDIFSYHRLQASSDLQNGFGNIYSYKNSEKIIAFFTRLQLDIHDAFFLSATLRREGSSRLGSSRKWGYFPCD